MVCRLRIDDDESARPTMSSLSGEANLVRTCCRVSGSDRPRSSLVKVCLFVCLFVAVLFLDGADSTCQT